MRERPRHPSGRPVRERQVKERSIWRIPDDGYVTPRLRDPRRDLSLVGFHHVADDTKTDD